MKNKILYVVIAGLLFVVILLVFYRNDKLSNVAATLNSIDTDICGSTVSLPKSYEVLAASVYAGSANYTLPAEYNGYKAVDVVVTVTKPTVIILTGYEQNVWNIKATQPDLVKAILLAGYYDQKAILNDLKAKVIGGKNSICQGSYYDEKEIEQLNQYSQSHLKRNVDALFLLGETSYINMSDSLIEPLKNKLKNQLQAYTKKTTPVLTSEHYIQLPESDEGMQKALQLGLIRPATYSDVKQFDLAKIRQTNGSNTESTVIVGLGDNELRHEFYPDHSYVILKPFKFPRDMYGAHSATFYLPEGVAYPIGELSHSTLYNMNDGTCRGTACGQ